MQIVSNTTSISELYKIEQLDLLRITYGYIYIPDAVFQELLRAKTLPHLGKTIEQSGWITICSINFLHRMEALLSRYSHIHRGEAAAIVLAQELGAQRIILDDKKARQIAQAEGLAVIGTVGIILLAYRLGHINKPQARDILDRLYEGTAYISKSLYRAAIQQIQH